jgi:aminoglycoside phosphotransferase (APT) family kinase protein
VSDTDEIIAACRRMNLITPDEQPAITALSGGVSSFIVRVDTARGSICVKRALPQLRVATEWRAPVERNGAEVAWMSVAGQLAPGFVPRILGVDRELQAFAMNYLDPTEHRVWKEQLRDGVICASTAQSVATNLLAIHKQTAKRPDVARAFANDATFFSIRLDPYFAAAARVHPDCASTLHALMETTANTKLALVHGDVSPKNILVGAHGAVLLDAECACYGDPAFDVAFCLNHLLLKCLWRPAYVAGYLACFDAFTSSYLPALSWEPRSQFEQRACLLLAAMMLARVDGKSPVEYLTEESEREVVRRFARRYLLAPAQRLDAIRNVWSVELR